MYERDISNKEGEPAFVGLHDAAVPAAVVCAVFWLAPCQLHEREMNSAS